MKFISFRNKQHNQQQPAGHVAGPELLWLLGSLCQI
jgi:hypothetical protein